MGKGETTMMIPEVSRRSLRTMASIKGINGFFLKSLWRVYAFFMPGALLS
jgi:hypothetical protein